MWENGPEAIQTICELLAFAVALGDSVFLKSWDQLEWTIFLHMSSRYVYDIVI